MSYFQYIDRMKRMDNFIRLQATGSAEELGEKLGVCRRTVFEYLDIIKSKGAEVNFDKRRKTFYYENIFELNF